MAQADICKYIILSDTDRKKRDLQYPHLNVVHRLTVAGATIRCLCDSTLTRLERRGPRAENKAVTDTTFIRFRGPKAPKGQMGLASRNGRPSHWFVPWTRLGAGGAVSEVWELGSRAVRKILRNNSGLYWIGRFPILQLSFAIDSRGGRSFSQRSAQARRH